LAFQQEDGSLAEGAAALDREELHEPQGIAVCLPAPEPLHLIRQDDLALGEIAVIGKRRELANFALSEMWLERGNVGEQAPLQRLAALLDVCLQLLVLGVVAPLRV